MKLEIEGSGKSFDLKPMTLNQISELESVGINLMSAKYKDEFKVSHLTDIVFVLIKDQDPAVTREWVGSVINIHNYTKVSEVVTSFLTPRGGQVKKTTSKK